MKKTGVYFLLLLFLMATKAVSQSYSFEESTFVYKKVNGAELQMVMYKPNVSEGVITPALVFFFGGGWVSGSPEHFRLQAEYFATRGITVFCPDYRTNSKFGTSPFESLKDAKTAVRYLKTHGKELAIDTGRIVVSGGSAGGHLAACTALIENVNEDTDDLSVSTNPLAMILFNPVVDTGKRGYGQEKLGGREFEISPVHHITSNVPLTLIMHGMDDKTVPYENVVRFKQLMKQAGNKCILEGYKKQEHGFFNYEKKPKYFKKTLSKTEAFLDELNLLRGESWIGQYCKQLAVKE